MISARWARLTMVALWMVSEASFSFGTTSAGVVVGADERVRESDLLDDALDAVDGDTVAETERLGERDQDAGDEVAERPLRGETDDDPDHGARGEQRACHRPDLREHEQRREHGDHDDHRRHGPAQHAVARLGAGAQLHAPHGEVGDLRQDDRGDDHHRGDRCAFPERHRPAIRRGARRFLRSGGGRRSRRRTRARKRSRPHPAASRATRPGLRGPTGSRPDPVSRSLTTTPRAWISSRSAGELGRSTAHPGVDLGEPGRRKPAAVARDPGRDVVCLRLGGVERALCLDHAFDQRPHGRQQLVRLVRCEVHFHQPKV